MLIAQLTGSQMVLPYLKCPWGKTISSFIYTTKSKHSLARETGLHFNCNSDPRNGKVQQSPTYAALSTPFSNNLSMDLISKRHWERGPTRFDKLPVSVHSSGPARQGWQHGTLPQTWDGSVLPTPGVLRVDFKLFWKQNLNSEQSGNKYILTLKHILKNEFRYVLFFFPLK